MSKFSAITLILNAIALVAAASWLYSSHDFEPLITCIALIASLSGQVHSIRTSKADSIALRTLSTFQRDFSAHLSRTESGFNQEKQVRAARFITQNGQGNETFKRFLNFLFPSLDIGLLNAYKHKIFEDLCSEAGVRLEIMIDSDVEKFWLKDFQKEKRLQMSWYGNGIFEARGNPSFGAYGSDKHLFLSEQALSDFKKIHSLFLNYVDNLIPGTEMNIEITGDGLVPSNL